MFEISVTHTISAGHRIVGHDGGKGKCARLHGHNYTFIVTLRADRLDATGFVFDFGLVKVILDEWDHRMLLWDADPIFPTGEDDVEHQLWEEDSGIVRVPWNPTAENMAEALARAFVTLGAQWARVEVQETAKTSAIFEATK